MVVVAFFIAHWGLSVFMQSFFLHRYGAHKMFTMNKGWERLFHVLTFVCQGSSYLEPRGYAILHRMHHAFSDTCRDPHSPSNHRGPAAPLTMMWVTKLKYDAVAYGGPSPEARFDGDVPAWPAFDRIAQTWFIRVAWGVAYTLFYVAFATEWWQFLLLPIHYVMGPVHGAIVNWCGHMYGYRGHRTSDDSRNTLPIDVLCAGELFQNNHHHRPRNANFASRWFEIDPTYQIIRVLAALGVLRLVVRPA